MESPYLDLKNSGMYVSGLEGAVGLLTAACGHLFVDVGKLLLNPLLFGFFHLLLTSLFAFLP
ncbi:hypothetical protein DPMN_124378 [Dreissena polymorpha]|uniref:Uncharacterized protein n=1 Tax=Dreissena polymorpha TaxID=45954 RepID=A0A9D4GSJ1_DREPO|nr:hypothetical protein DPMN_124378 [Dreissena polymorpha]